jgi:hypothetical protein
MILHGKSLIVIVHFPPIRVLLQDFEVSSKKEVQKNELWGRERLAAASKRYFTLTIGLNDGASRCKATTNNLLLHLILDIRAGGSQGGRVPSRHYRASCHTIVRRAHLPSPTPSPSPFSPYDPAL